MFQEYAAWRSEAPLGVSVLRGLPGPRGCISSCSEPGTACPPWAPAWRHDPGLGRQGQRETAGRGRAQGRARVSSTSGRVDKRPGSPGAPERGCRAFGPESCFPPGPLGPRFGSLWAGRARRPGSRVPGELGPGQQRFPAASSRAPSRITSSRSHSGKELHSPWESRGEGLSTGPPGSRRCQTRASVTPPGVCLPSDRWEGSWLLSAFRGDRAGLKQADGMALSSAGWLPAKPSLF